MSQVCPISFKQVNAKAAQVNAVFTVFGMLMFLLSPAKWIIVLMLVDFFVRGFMNPAYSLFNIASESVLRLTRVEPQMTNAGPKVFAARIGFVFVCLITTAWLLQLCTAAFILASTLAVFAALEAVFNFCVACKAYPLLLRITNTSS